MSHDVTDFQSQVLDRSRTIPVLVDFWAAWCGPCRMLTPVLERLAAEAADRWALAKVNTEELPEISERYGIASIPNVKLFVGGEIVDEFVGALPEREVRRWLERALPSRARARVQQARGMIERGRFRDAETLLEAAPPDESQDRDLRLALAEARLHTRPDAAMATVRGLEDEPGISDRVLAVITLARLLEALDRPDSLPDTPMRGRYLAGLDAVKAGDWSIALEALIEVVRTERGFAEGAARDAVRAIFVLLGPGHPMIETYHRAFSSAVNV